MNKVYQKIKGKSVKYSDCEGIVCGYGDSTFLVATETKPSCSFRRLEKDMFVEEEFKDTKYRYFYVTEAEVFRQHSRMKRI